MKRTIGLVFTLRACHDRSCAQTWRGGEGNVGKREKHIAIFATALVGAAMFHKVASKEAKALGLSVGAMAVLNWIVTQAV
ncbi:hypothetical protein [Streptomyces sp. BBFR109]|uniref:hypothetical protein n=1 Tax=Streptomyces sp. BBFR109 TaxID=3448172 RepID=UPI003F75AE30